MQGDPTPLSLSKKAGGEAGEPHRPFDLPTGGGIIPPEGTLGSELLTRLPEGAAGGRDRCRHTRQFSPIMIRLNRIIILSVSSSALRKRHGDEARRSAALDAHQNAVLVVGARSVDRLAHVSGIGHVLSRYFQNDVSFLEAAFGRSTLRIDLGDNDAFLAGAGNAVGGCYRQAELRHIGPRGGAYHVLIVIVGLGFNRIGQLAKRQIDHLVLAL